MKEKKAALKLKEKKAALKEKNAAIAVGIELASVHCGRDGQMDQFDQPKASSPKTTKLSRPQAPESKYRMVVPSVKQE